MATKKTSKVPTIAGKGKVDTKKVSKPKNTPAIKVKTAIITKKK